MFTLYRIAFMPAAKLHRIGILFTRKNGDVAASSVNPGSHMALLYLRHGRRYCPGYCSDMRTEVAGNIGHPIFYHRHAYEVDSSSTSQASRR